MKFSAMKTNGIFVFDTNALLSAHLIEGSVNNVAFKKALKLGGIAISTSLLTEFAQVIYRSKFDKYFLTDDVREELIHKIESHLITFEPIEKITEAPDPDDNIILELALAASATAIITGDKKLLSLNPFRGIPIISASNFLKMF